MWWNRFLLYLLVPLFAERKKERERERWRDGEKESLVTPIHTPCTVMPIIGCGRCLKRNDFINAEKYPVRNIHASYVSS
jgi:hypothetical protein